MNNLKLILLLNFIVPTFNHFYGISSGKILSFWDL
jgi:hypothetical protein